MTQRITVHDIAITHDCPLSLGAPCTLYPIKKEKGSPKGAPFPPACWCSLFGSEPPSVILHEGADVLRLVQQAGHLVAVECDRETSQSVH